MSKPWEEKWAVIIINGRCDGVVQVDEEGKLDHTTPVVETDSGVYPPSIPQAHLISAAPELYLALEALLSWSQSEYDSNPRIDAQAEAALRKARGET